MFPTFYEPMSPNNFHIIISQNFPFKKFTLEPVSVSSGQFHRHSSKKEQYIWLCEPSHQPLLLTICFNVWFSLSGKRVKYREMGKLFFLLLLYKLFYQYKGKLLMLFGQNGVTTPILVKSYCPCIKYIHSCQLISKLNLWKSLIIELVWGRFFLKNTQCWGHIAHSQIYT